MLCPLLSSIPHQMMRTLCHSMQNFVLFRLIFFPDFYRQCFGNYQTIRYRPTSRSALFESKQLLKTQAQTYSILSMEMLLFCSKLKEVLWLKLGDVLTPSEMNTQPNDANSMSIDAEFCPLSTHIFSRFLSAVLWKLSNNLWDLNLERRCLHNGSTLIGLEKTKEIQFFEVYSANIDPKNMKPVGDDRPSNSASFDV